MSDLADILGTINDLRGQRNSNVPSDLAATILVVEMTHQSDRAAAIREIKKLVVKHLSTGGED